MDEQRKVQETGKRFSKRRGADAIKVLEVLVGGQDWSVYYAPPGAGPVVLIDTDPHLRWGMSALVHFSEK